MARRMISLLAKFDVKPEECDRFVALLRAHTVASRGEPGCLAFELLREREDTTKFAAFEVFADAASREAHRHTPHMAHLVSQLPSLLAKSGAATQFSLRELPAAPRVSLPGAIALAVHIQGQEAHMDALLAEIETNAAAARQEPGCLMFEPLRPVDLPHHVSLFEMYTGDAALEAHFATPHFKRYLECAVPLMQGERVKTLYDVIS